MCTREEFTSGIECDRHETFIITYSVTLFFGFLFIAYRIYHLYKDYAIEKKEISYLEKHEKKELRRM